MATNYFKLNSPDIISESFEEEIIALNMKRGVYYVIGQSGVPIWNQVSQGATLEEILSNITQSYQGEDTVIVPAVQNFLDQLRQVELIVNIESNSSPQTSSPKLSTANCPSTPFIPPTLSENTDIQDILLLDPVHEVKKHSWFA